MLCFMSICHEGLCQGPQQCWLREYLRTPGPTPLSHPELEPDDVNAARQMTKCPIRDELRQEFPEVFRRADKPKQK